MLSKFEQQLSMEEIQRMFLALDTEINNGIALGGAPLLLMRDKAMFITMYLAGLSVYETHKLDINSVSSKETQGGDRLWHITVLGKRTAGNRPQRRSIAISNPQFTRLIEWYVPCVRKKLLKAGDTAAFFLSSKGVRINAATVSKRFEHLMTIAGLSDRKLTPNCFRQAYATYELSVQSQETDGRKHAERSSRTMQAYLQMFREHMGKATHDSFMSEINNLKGE